MSDAAVEAVFAQSSGGSIQRSGEYHPEKLAGLVSYSASAKHDQV